MTEWLTVAAIASTIFAFMMIFIMTRRYQIQREKARKIRMAYRKSTQREGMNRS